MKEEFINKHPDTTFETPVTVGLLLDYTNEVLLPAFDNMMDDKFKVNNARLENNLKTYIDRRLQETVETLLKRIDKRFEEEKKFHHKIIEIFKKQHFGSTEDIAYLEGLTS